MFARSANAPADRTSKFSVEALEYTFGVVVQSAILKFKRMCSWERANCSLSLKEIQTGDESVANALDRREMFGMLILSYKTV